MRPRGGPTRAVGVALFGLGALVLLWSVWTLNFWMTTQPSRVSGRLISGAYSYHDVRPWVRYVVAAGECAGSEVVEQVGPSFLAQYGCGAGDD